MRECMVSTSEAANVTTERQRRLAKVYKMLIRLARMRRAVSLAEIGEAALEMDDAQCATG